MPIPADHAELLRQSDFPIPPSAILTADEQQTLSRFGHWMHALALGHLLPSTPDQERFVRAARGLEVPATAFEIAWVKAFPPQFGVSAEALAQTAMQLEQARETALAAQREDVTRRLDILAKVQPELDALDAELSPRLKLLQAEVARLEAILKDRVRLSQRSYRRGPVSVTYSRGRVTFESKGMQEYAVSHPEVNQYRKIGQPIVVLRYVSEENKPLPSGQNDAGTDDEETTGLTTS